MKKPSFRGGDEVQFAAVNLPREKRQSLPRERTMGTGCISKISISVSEDIYTASVRGAKNQCFSNRRSNLKSKWRWVVRVIIQILKS